VCLMQCCVVDPHHFNADPDLDIPFNVDTDPDPVSHQSGGNLRPLVYRTSRAPF
jgi:hypothetical protein